MGAGEYVSVSSQADTERADLELERRAPERDNALNMTNFAIFRSCVASITISRPKLPSS